MQLNGPVRGPANYHPYPKGIRTPKEGPLIA
jgi:hypothetical protein